MAKNTNLVRCTTCGLVFKARVPKGGDGSAWFPAFHKRGAGERCEGSYEEGLEPEKTQDRCGQCGAHLKWAGYVKGAPTFAGCPHGCIKPGDPR